MAIDPRISLATQPVNVMEAITGGLDVGDRIRTSGVRDQILNNQAESGQQALEANRRKQALESTKYTYEVYEGLKGVPMSERPAILAQQRDYLREIGVDTKKLSLNLSDQAIDGFLGTMRPLIMSGEQELAQTASQKDFNFFQSIVDDPASTPEQVRAAKVALGVEATAGRGQLKETGVPGVYQVFDANANTLSEPMKRDETGNLVPLSRAEQLQAGLTEQVEAKETLGQAETSIAVDRAEQLGDVALNVSAEEQAENIRQTRASARKTEFANNLQTSRRALPRLTEALKLAETADQGLQGVAKLQLAKVLPNIDVSDIAALDSALTTLALDELQKFKGPTTDFEFGVTQNISGQLIGSQQANIARIAALQRNNWFLGREAEQFNDWVDGGGDPDRFAFNFSEIVPTSKGDFTLQQVQDTAVSNNMSIEQVLEALNK